MTSRRTLSAHRLILCVRLVKVVTYNNISAIIICPELLAVFGIVARSLHTVPLIVERIAVRLALWRDFIHFIHIHKQLSIFHTRINISIN